MISILAGPTEPALATVPSTTSYQGVLTDNAGNLVPDGLYNFTFRIYDVGSGGAALWTENQNNITVSKGGFAATLGAVNPLALAFDRPYYLGVSVNAGSELVPRVVLAPAPQALSLRLPFAGADGGAGPSLSITNTGGGAAIVADPALVVGGAAGSGRLDVRGGGAPGAGAIILEAASGGQLGIASPAGAPVFGASSLLIPDWGYAYVSGPTGHGIGISANGNSPGTPDPYLLLLGASRTALLDMSLAGDASVRLPADAVSAGELRDEPGIAQARSSGSVEILPGPALTDLASVTITTPEAGYIVVEANGQHGLGYSGTNRNLADLTIDETSGGPLDPDYWFISGFDGVLPAGGDYRPVSMRRTFFKAAGTHTFYFRGVAFNPGASWNYMWQPSLIATFVPTSYGAVVTAMAAAGAARDGLGGRPVAAQQTPAGQVRTLNAVEVDLRQLELRAAKLREAAMEAEMAVIRARGIVPATARRGVADAAKP